MATHTEERKTRISEALKRFYTNNHQRRKELSESFKKARQTHPENFEQGSRQGGLSAAINGNSKYVKRLDSLLDASSRTVRKVLKRLGRGCSRCGWSEGVCDVHHIRGRRIANPNNHSNLSLLCPNCHRLVHEGQLKPEDLVSLTDYIGDDWKSYYYGVVKASIA